MLQCAAQLTFRCGDRAMFRVFARGAHVDGWREPNACGGFLRESQRIPGGSIAQY